MTAIQTIPVNDRRETFIASAGQTVFPYDFPVYAAADLQVRRVRSGTETMLTLAVDYTVTGAGLQAGGNVTLTTPALADDQITILSAQPASRLSAYSAAGDLRADALNGDFNRLWIVQQQLTDQLLRVLRLPATDPAANLDLPPIAARASRYLAFDAAGAPIAAAGTAGTPTSPYIATLLDDPDAATARATLGTAAAVDAPPSGWTDLASAATTDIGAVNTQNIRITGTTTITSFGSTGGGRRQLRFAGALTLTHNATSLFLPGGSNITTAAGDTAVAVSLGGGNWVVTDYQFASGDIVARAGSLRSQLSGAPTTGQVVLGNGTARLFYTGSEFDLNGPLRVDGKLVGINLGTSVNTTSGTSIDFTGIPAGVRRVTVMLNGVSTNGTSPQIIQLGTSGGITASGYDSVGTGYGNTITSAAYTTGFGISDSSVAANALGGTYILSLAGSNVWTLMGLARRAAAVGTLATGSVGLSGALDRLRLTTVGGADTFDAGSINISWEF